MKYRYELDQLRYNASKATGIDECENKQASSVKRFIQPWTYVGVRYQQWNFVGNNIIVLTSCFYYSKSLFWEWNEETEIWA